MFPRLLFSSLCFLLVLIFQLSSLPPAFSSWIVLTTHTPLSSRHPEVLSRSHQPPPCTLTPQVWATFPQHRPSNPLLRLTRLPPWSRPSGRSCCVSRRNSRLCPVTTAEASGLPPRHSPATDTACLLHLVSQYFLWKSPGVSSRGTVLLTWSEDVWWDGRSSLERTAAFSSFLCILLMLPLFNPSRPIFQIFNITATSRPSMQAHNLILSTGRVFCHDEPCYALTLWRQKPNLISCQQRRQEGREDSQPARQSADW